MENVMHTSMANRSNNVTRVLLLLVGGYAAFLLLSTQSGLKTSTRKSSFRKSVHHSSYNDELTELLNQPPPHYVLFTSGYYENSTIPWDMVSKVRGSLLEVEVGTREGWRNPQHPLKVDAKVPVKYLPTLYHWTSDGPGDRISNELNHDTEVETLRVLVATFIKETAKGSRVVDAFTRQVIESKGKNCGGC